MLAWALLGCPVGFQAEEREHTYGVVPEAVMPRFPDTNSPTNAECMAVCTAPGDSGWEWDGVVFPEGAENAWRLNLTLRRLESSMEEVNAIL